MSHPRLLWLPRPRGKLWLNGASRTRGTDFTGAEWRAVGFHFQSARQFAALMQRAWAEATPVAAGRHGGVKLWAPGAGIEVWLTGDRRGRFQFASPHVFGPSGGGFVVAVDQERRRGWLRLRAVDATGQGVAGLAAAGQTAAGKGVAGQTTAGLAAGQTAAHPGLRAVVAGERSHGVPIELDAVNVAWMLGHTARAGDEVAVTGFARGLVFTDDRGGDANRDEQELDAQEPDAILPAGEGADAVVRGVVRDVQWRTNPVFRAGYYVLVVDVNGLLLDIVADVEHLAGRPSRGAWVTGSVALRAAVMAQTARIPGEEGARACYVRGAALIAGGRTAAGLDQWSCAVARLEGLVGERADLVPVLIDLLYQRGQAWAQQAWHAAATADFGRVLTWIEQARMGQLELRMARAMALSARGRCQAELDHPQDAQADLDEAIDLWSGEAGGTGGGWDRGTEELAACLHSRGFARQKVGDAPGALADYDRSIALREEPAAVRPGVHAEFLAHTMHNRAFLLGLLDRWDESVAGYRESIRLRRKLLDQEQHAKVNVEGLARSYANLGARLAAETSWDEALRHFAAAIRLREERLPRSAEHDEAIAWAVLQRGEVYMRREDWARAEREFDKAIRLQAHLCAAAGADGADEGRLALARTHMRRALARYHGARLEEAAADCDAALRNLDPGANPDHALGAGMAAVAMAGARHEQVLPTAGPEHRASTLHDVCQAHYVRGLIRQSMGLQPDAIDDWRVSVQFLDEMADLGLPIPPNAAKMRAILALAGAQTMDAELKRAQAASGAAIRREG